jgi:hypothetical protein
MCLNGAYQLDILEDWKNTLCYGYDRTLLNTVQILGNLVYLFNNCFISTAVLQQADRLKEVHTNI